MKTDNTGRPLPKWKCHKEVQAVKIRQIVVHDPPPGMDCKGGFIFPEGSEWPIEVDVHYLTKHVPEIGGYYVVYADGYESFSPATAFEEGYTRQ